MLFRSETPLERPEVIVGISRRGLDLPGARQPVAVAFVILGSRQRDAQLHLDLMAAIAERVQTPGWVEMLRKAGSDEEAGAIIRSRQPLAP